MVCFRQKRHVLILSDTEKQAIDFLGDVKNQILENDLLRKDFDIGVTVKDTETEFIFKFTDGKWCRLLAKGSGQKLRGMKYRNARPDLCVADDIENDELVMNQERRLKFREWFMGALIPALSKSGQIRVVGTILHFDSLLERLLHNKKWKHLRFAAHNEDFSFILWPEQYDRERLEELRQIYIDDGTPELYSCEYLNYPLDISKAYFKETDLHPFEKDDLAQELRYYIGVDLAISKKQRADYSVFAICGLDFKGILYTVDVIRGRMDTNEILDTLFDIQEMYEPELFVIEHGVLSKAIEPVLISEMYSRNVFLNLPDKPFVPTHDKETRARPLQARARVGGIRFDPKANYYSELKEEMQRFPRGAHDDQVDALAWVCHALKKALRGRSPHEIKEDDYDEQLEAARTDDPYARGRSRVCGY